MYDATTEWRRTSIPQRSIRIVPQTLIFETRPDSEIVNTRRVLAPAHGACNTAVTQDTPNGVMPPVSSDGISGKTCGESGPVTCDHPGALRSGCERCDPLRRTKDHNMITPGRSNNHIPQTFRDKKTDPGGPTESANKGEIARSARSTTANEQPEHSDPSGAGGQRANQEPPCKENCKNIHPLTTMTTDRRGARGGHAPGRGETAAGRRIGGVGVSQLGENQLGGASETTTRIGSASITTLAAVGRNRPNVNCISPPASSPMPSRRGNVALSLNPQFPNNRLSPGQSLIDLETGSQFGADRSPSRENLA